MLTAPADAALKQRTRVGEAVEGQPGTTMRGPSNHFSRSGKFESVHDTPPFFYLSGRREALAASQSPLPHPRTMSGRSAGAGLRTVEVEHRSVPWMSLQ